MSNIGYDLDTSGGLMPLIRALIKPPDDESNAQKTKKHPYYKRPGKGHNHDSCDACGEGGDLICCDRCPASFHLGCYDPPLDQSDIPPGQWLCKECRGSEVEKPASTRSSRAQSPVDAKPREEPEKKTRSLRNNRSNSNQSAKKKGKDESKDKEGTVTLEELKKEERELSPMEILVKAAKIMNPRQFELPREMRMPCAFPGTDKDGGKDGNGGPSVVTVDSWGCVPLPAKACFVCQETCKMAPLLQCDYCPLLFHQDCLDPPLTALPTGRWMCPNHVEQYIDWKLVNSISATERVALWERFSGPVDQHAIKVDFIRRARRAKPAFRMKVPVCARGRVIVPPMVRDHYLHPPPLLPSRREYVRCTRVLKELKNRGVYEEHDERDGRKRVICLNMRCPKYTRGGVCPHDYPRLEGVSEDDAASDLRAISDNRPSYMITDSEDSESDIEDMSMAPMKRRKTAQDASEDKSAKRKAEVKQEPRLELRADDAEAAELLAMAERQLQRLDERLVKLLAWQRLQQLLIGERCAGPWRRAPLSARAEALVTRSVDRGRLTRHGFRHVALPSQLLSRADHERIARAVWGSPPDEPGCETPTSPGHSLSDATVRATLCPIERPSSNGGLGDGLGRPVPMRLSRLSVGSGGGCDVPLARYGHCERISALHALIFYDEVSRHFELINYSEWGSRVNGALYACDVHRERAAPPLAAQDAQDAEARAQAVREIARRRQRAPVRLNGDLTVGKPSRRCQCPADRDRSAAEGAWEGSALLCHGTLLQFGCLMFVFSVTDELPADDDDDEDDNDEDDDDDDSS